MRTHPHVYMLSRVYTERKGKTRRAATHRERKARAAWKGKYKTIAMEKNGRSCNNRATERKLMDDWKGREKQEKATTKVRERLGQGSRRTEIVMEVQEKCVWQE